MSFDALYGLELTDCSDSLVRGRVPVRDELMQVSGSVHGGVYSAISEALAVRGTSVAVGGEGQDRGRALEPDDVAAPDHGRHDPRHRGPPAPGTDDLGVGGRHLDDDRQRCAVARVTIAVSDG